MRMPCPCAPRLAALSLWLALAAARGAPPPGGGVLPPAPAADFAQALTVRPFVFPRDHGPHPEYRQEWWYVTGNLESGGGERFGFELTFFRFALAPPSAAAAAASAAAPPSAWRAREIYMAHFAVTDVARRRFRFADRLERAALGLAGARSDPLRVWVDDWSLGQGAAAAAPAAGTSWTLRAAQPGYEIELTLEPQTAPVLNGTAGLSRKSDEPTAASYYYSLPRLVVRGRLRRADGTLAVRGSAWLDREWGSGSLGSQQVGWDWFALQLDDGSALMFYALRDRDGARDAHSAGTWISPDGTAQALRSADVAIEVTGHWRNARGVRYPARWHIRVADPSLDVSVQPVLDDQELHTHPPYWEGAVDVSGQRAGASVSGRGYVELVGYAQEH